MGYEILTAMRSRNQLRYGIDAPVVPDPAPISGFGSAALRFLRETCTNLWCDPADQAHGSLEDRDGTSAGPQQIPLFMQHDLDRLCLEQALTRYLRSSLDEDAFDLFYCAARFCNEPLSSIFSWEPRQHLAQADLFIAGLERFQTEDILPQQWARNGGPAEFLEQWCRSILLSKPQALLEDLYRSCQIKHPREVPPAKAVNFQRLYQLAIALNARYQMMAGHISQQAELDSQFRQLSLEYQLSNINQAKAFTGYLDRLGYVCKAVSAPVPVQQFSDEELQLLGLWEHDRWEQEKRSMGWTPGTAYREQAERAGLPPKLLREQTRTHHELGIPYVALTAAAQNKDTDPMNTLLKQLQYLYSFSIIKSKNNRESR